VGFHASIHSVDDAGDGSMTPFEVVLERLGDRITRRHDGRVQARCPSHDDRHASLSVSIGYDERALLKCFAGCSVERIVAALDLTMPELSRHDMGRGNGTSPIRLVASNTSRTGLTLAQYAEAKQLPIDFLTSLGLTECSYESATAVRIPYRLADGQDAAVQFRLALTGADRFRWRKGSKPLPYGLWRLHEAKTAGSIVLVEGASDAHTLWLHQIPALGIPGASMWRPDWDHYLADIARIDVVLEPDQGGDTIYQWISGWRFREKVQLIALDGAKDPSELYLQAPDQFPAAWQAALNRARAWSAIDVERRTQDAIAYDAAAGPLLRDPCLLDRVGEAIHACGYAGNLNVPLLVYIGLTSRALDRPLNLALVGPSAAGKNRAVDIARALIPPEAVYVVTAGSARALVYSAESFEHRMVIFGEADSIPEDGPAAAAVRSIAEDQRMVYDVVEKHGTTGQHATRRIEKPGPTGLITTSTKSLGEQLGTRVLEVPMSDEEGQTRSIMRAHASRVQPNARREIDLEPLLAVQRWLTVAGVREIVIPFSDWLAERLPAHTVRMRRDFRQLLTTIQAVAFLYQCQRDRTPDGAIIATIDDYDVARRLLAPIFDSLAAEAVTPAVRQTVETIQSDEEVSEGELARRLGLAKSTVSYRVRRALRGGWILNRETRQGHTARLARGAALPQAMSALPSVEELQQVFDGSNEVGEHPLPSPAQDVTPQEDRWTVR
jgi:hypothetical protein